MYVLEGVHQVAELSPGNPFEWWRSPGDCHDLARAILGVSVGWKVAGRHGSAFARVIAAQDPAGFEISERDVAVWLKTR